MAEELVISHGERDEIYRDLIPQIKALVGDERDIVANLANVAAALKQAFNFFWVGFYLVKDDELVLGPFQGPVACTRIQKNKGVCGASWESQKTLLVDNVEEFPGHIACSSLSKSEIVLPLIKDGVVVAILDLDSDKIAYFNAIDQKYLSNLCEWLVTVI